MARGDFPHRRMHKRRPRCRESGRTLLLAREGGSGRSASAPTEAQARGPARGDEQGRDSLSIWDVGSSRTSCGRGRRWD
jgi:hypothetical protein